MIIFNSNYYLFILLILVNFIVLWLLCSREGWVDPSSHSLGSYNAESYFCFACLLVSGLFESKGCPYLYTPAPKAGPATVGLKVKVG